ncbi:MAG: hypothetical protein QXR54_02675 [Nanopusillaceae archaeon]
MAIKLKKLSSTYKSKVYTEEGYYLGEVEDAIISNNKIYGWKIKVAEGSLVKKGVKGIIVQHQLVKAMGQIWIVSKIVGEVEKSEQTEQTEEKVEK